MTTEEIRASNLRTQYEVLQVRVVAHGSRLWQLPFSYAGFSAVATPIAVSNAQTVPVSAFFFGLAVIGLIVMACMIGAWRGYRRTAGNMNDVEEALGIERYTKAGSWHTVPYFALAASSVVAVLGMGIHFSG